MTSQKVYFRADADKQIGYGHFIRTLALADMLKDDYDCTYFTVSPNEYQIREMGAVCKHMALRTEDAMDEFLRLLKGDEIVVLDNYFYGTEYQAKVRARGCKLVVIDDLHDRHHVADVVIHHGFVPSEKFDCESYTLKCIGPEWALLRKPFLRVDRQPARTDGIVVCLGGADPLGLSEKVVDALLRLDLGREIKVIVGDASVFSTDSRERVTALSRLSADEMSDVLRTSGYAVLTASTVCLEALYCGARILCGHYVGNQEEAYRHMVDHGLVSALGYLPELTDATLRTALDLVRSKTGAAGFCGDDVVRRYLSVFRRLT